MPRSTLFPYTTLFRSLLQFARFDSTLAVQEPRTVVALRLMFTFVPVALVLVGRSEERFSRNAEIYTLSLHDALPISPAICKIRQHPGGARAPHSCCPSIDVHLCPSRACSGRKIGRAVQQECRDLHSFPTRRSSDLSCNLQDSTAPWRCKSPAQLLPFD